MRLVFAGYFLAMAIGTASISANDGEVLDNSFDPSGGWISDVGELSLMHTGNTLSFSYLAVFGPSAHICDGAGVAGLIGPNRYEWVDAQGTVVFFVDEGGVSMEVVDGIASFCGSGWAGDFFAPGDFVPTDECVVETERSHFAVVEVFSPEPRRAYVVKGDRVEVVQVHNEGNESWVLARFVGKNTTTVGLVSRADLACPEK